MCLSVIIPLSHGSDDTVDQSTDGVCSSNLPAPFQASQHPNGRVLEKSVKRVRLRPTFDGGNANRAAPFANKTEPHPPAEIAIIVLPGVQ